MKEKVYTALSVACLAAISAVVPVQAESPVKLGELNCQVSDYDDGLLSAEINLDCSYIDAKGNNAGTYKGTIDRAGLEIGSIKTEKFTWIVSTLGDPTDAKIGGTYIGATAGASVGAGAGGNYLTGGFQGKISLQPLSAETKSGIGISLEGQTLTLQEVEI